MNEYYSKKWIWYLFWKLYNCQNKFHISKYFILSYVWFSHKQQNVCLCVTQKEILVKYIYFTKLIGMLIDFFYLNGKFQEVLFNISFYYKLMYSLSPLKQFSSTTIRRTHGFWLVLRVFLSLSVSNICRICFLPKYSRI